MPHVDALYRYPVKGLTPEHCESLTVLDEGRIAGDRVLGFRFANATSPDDAWCKKTMMAVLMNTPGLARLRVRFDREKLRLRVCLDEELLAEQSLTIEGRQAIAAALQEYICSLPENPLSGHPERLPLRLVGDGITPRYHDSEAGRVTLHGRGSVETLGAELNLHDLEEARFRSNIAVAGLAPWEELGWVGRRLRIGAVEFEVIKPKTRCLATHANPMTGNRDLPILNTLTKVFGQKKPTFAVAIAPAQHGGEIHVGDPVYIET